MKLDMNRHPFHATKLINQWINGGIHTGMDGYFVLPLIPAKSDFIVASTLKFNGTRHMIRFVKTKKYVLHDVHQE